MDIIAPSQYKSTPISKNVTPTTKRDPQGKGLPALAGQASPAPLEFAGEITRLERRKLLAKPWINRCLYMKVQNKVTVMDYGEGYVEATWGKSNPEKRKCAVRGRSKNREINKEKSKRQAMASVRRKCMAAGLDHLVTLTYRENIVDKEKAWHHFEQFIRLVHTYFPDWLYVCTKERQERGAIHFHMGVKGYQDVTLLRSLWRCVAGDGNIDVSYVKTKKGVQWQRQRLASYLAKYISKDMENELNERRYRASLGIEIPKQIIYLHPAINPMEYVTYKIESIAGQVAYVWSPEESKGLYGWACSWG